MPPERQTEVRTRLRQTGRAAEGMVAKFHRVKEQKGDPNPGDRLRTLRRQLARLYEIRRCCDRDITPSAALLHVVASRR